MYTATARRTPQAARGQIARLACGAGRPQRSHPSDAAHQNPAKSQALECKTRQALPPQGDCATHGIIAGMRRGVSPSRRWARTAHSPRQADSSPVVVYVKDVRYILLHLARVLQRRPFCDAEWSNSRSTPRVS